MKPMSLLMISILAISTVSYADNGNSCKRFYGQLGRVTFFTTPLSKTDLNLSPQFLADGAAAAKNQVEINQKKQELSSLYTQETTISREISKERSDRPLLKMFSKADPHNIRIAQLKTQLDQITSEIKVKSDEVKKLSKDIESAYKKIENQMSKDGTIEKINEIALAHFTKSLKDPSIIKIKVKPRTYFFRDEGRFKTTLTIEAHLYEQPFTLIVAVKTGIRKNKSGNLEVYSFVVAENEASSARKKLNQLANDEIFKRNSRLTMSINLKNGISIEEKFRKLGYDLNDPKIKTLVQGLKEQQFTNAKTAVRTQELLDAANQRYQDGLNDSQSLFLTNYFYYTLMTGNSNAFMPPNHWMLYHLQHGTPAQHAGLGESFTKAAELAQDKDITFTSESFDSIVKSDVSDILTVKEALDSPQYKSDLISEGIAETLGISESRIEQMDSQRIDDPAFSGGSEAEVRSETTTADTHSESADATDYSSSDNSNSSTMD